MIVNIDNGRKVRLPGPSDRISIIGINGSGKTHAAMWHLSNASFTSRPFIVINPKREELIAEIDATPFDVYDPIPKYPGIYDAQPLPSDEDAVSDLLLRAWERENVGFWIDEGFMFGDSPGLDAVLTQGRSKRCPVIFLMQRPVWVSRFAISEATFIQYFGLSDYRDRKTVAAFMENVPLDQPLKKWHSLYYDVRNRQGWKFSPMPEGNKIVNRINARLDTLRPQRKVI